MRSRNLKPGLYTNELLGAADPLVSLTFAGLWLLADREGRLEDRPLRIKAQLFPYREALEIHGYLTELERLGFIQRYAVKGQAYIQVLNFTKHQSPHHTEKRSQIPGPELKATPDQQIAHAPLGNGELTVNSRLSNGENPPDSLIHRFSDSPNPDSKTCSQQGYSPTPGITLPVQGGAGFEISEEQVSLWEKTYGNTDVKSELAKAREWLIANPKRRKTRRGMAKFCVSWLSRAGIDGRPARHRIKSLDAMQYGAGGVL